MKKLTLSIALMAAFAGQLIAQVQTISQQAVQQAEIHLLHQWEVLNELGNQLQMASSTHELQTTALALHAVVKPLADTFKLAHAAYEANSGDYATKLALYAAFTPYGFGYQYLPEALDAHSANLGFKPSAFRASVYRLEQLSAQLSRSTRPKKQARLKAAINHQLDQLNPNPKPAD